MDVFELESKIRRLKFEMEDAYAEAYDAFREASRLEQQCLEAIDELNSFKCAQKKEK